MIHGRVIRNAPEIRRAAGDGGPYKIVRWLFRNSFGGPHWGPHRAVARRGKEERTVRLSVPALRGCEVKPVPRRRVRPVQNICVINQASVCSEGRVWKGNRQGSPSDSITRRRAAVGRGTIRVPLPVEIVSFSTKKSPPYWIFWSKWLKILLFNRAFLVVLTCCFPTPVSHPSRRT